MALELFKPYLMAKLEEKGYTTALKAIKRLARNGPNEVWERLNEIVDKHLILLNRAPTLHKLLAQAFHPVLVDGETIRLYPLVYAAFNAGFDDNQVAAHVSLSQETITKAKVLMMSSINVLLPASNRAIAVPSQGMILGIYCPSSIKEDVRGGHELFTGANKIKIALDMRQIDLHAKIRARTGDRIIQTTVGRLITYGVLLGFVLADL